MIGRYALYSLLVGAAGIAVLIVASILMAMYVDANLLYPSPNSIAYNVAYVVVVVALYPFVIGSNYFWRRAVVSRVEGFKAVARWVWYGALVGVVSVVAVVLVWVAYYHAYWGFRVLVGS